eukprot:278503-Pleurochrysis_carterae.AAC.1
MRLCCRVRALHFVSQRLRNLTQRIALTPQRLRPPHRRLLLLLRTAQSPLHFSRARTRMRSLPPRRQRLRNVRHLALLALFHARLGADTRRRTRIRAAMQTRHPALGTSIDLRRALLELLLSCAQLRLQISRRLPLGLQRAMHLLQIGRCGAQLPPAFRRHLFCRRRHPLGRSRRRRYLARRRLRLRLRPLHHGLQRTHARPQLEYFCFRRLMCPL